MFVCMCVCVCVYIYIYIYIHIYIYFNMIKDLMEITENKSKQAVVHLNSNNIITVYN